MSGRRRPPPPSAHHDRPFRRRPLGPVPPHLLDEMRGEGPPFGPPGRLRHLPPQHPAAIEERARFQAEEIHHLLVDNQHLAATHVALKQELAATQQEIQRSGHALGVLQAEKDTRFREAYERSMTLETKLHQVDAMKNEIMQIRGDIQKLHVERQEMTSEFQRLSHSLSRAGGDVQQTPVIKQEIESLKMEIQHARACIEHEKKGYADSYESGQEMQKNLISMTREVEKLHNEIANVEKRARAAAAAGGQAAGYGGNYTNPGPDPSYGGNPYPAGYGMAPVPGNADVSAQYGPGSGVGPASGSGQAQASWGAYEMQHAQGRR